MWEACYNNPNRLTGSHWASRDGGGRARQCCRGKARTNQRLYWGSGRLGLKLVLLYNPSEGKSPRGMTSTEERNRSVVTEDRKKRESEIKQEPNYFIMSSTDSGTTSIVWYSVFLLHFYNTKMDNVEPWFQMHNFISISKKGLKCTWVLLLSSASWNDVILKSKLSKLKHMSLKE